MNSSKNNIGKHNNLKIINLKTITWKIKWHLYHTSYLSLDISCRVALGSHIMDPVLILEVKFNGIRLRSVLVLKII